MIKKIILSVFVTLFLVLLTGFKASAATEVGVAPTTAAAVESAIPIAAVPDKASALREDQIPLKMESLKNQAAPSQSGKLFLTLFVLLGMAGAAYYFVKKYAFSNKINKSNTQIKMLAQHHLGPKKSLAIIRVAGESILIGVTDQNISMIKSLSLIDDEIPAELAPQNFSQAMTEGETRPLEDLAQEIEDDFSFAGIKTNVSQKLKSMRNFQ